MIKDNNSHSNNVNKDSTNEDLFNNSSHEEQLKEEESNPSLVSFDAERRAIPKIVQEIFKDIESGDLDRLKVAEKRLKLLEGFSKALDNPNLNQYIEPAAPPPTPKLKTIYNMSYADYMVRKRFILAYEQAVLPITGKPIHVPLGKIPVPPRE